MSTFVYITCYDEHGREGGNIRRLRNEDLENVLESLPGFRLENDEGTWGIPIPGCDSFAALEGGTLSCQLGYQADVDQLLDQLRTLAAALPNAVVEDEEGEVY